MEWENFGDELIVPKNARKFIKSIQDKETRIAVANFIQKYARQYFREAAERQEYNEKAQNMFSVGVPDMPVKTADARVTLLQQELLFILDQEQSTGEFSGDKFNKQKKRIEELEKMVDDLVAKQVALKKTISEQNQTIDILRHPERQHQIPNELRCEEFYHIITYLQKSGYVIPRKASGVYQTLYYHWNVNTPKALFGYFVCKTCYLLELRTKDDHLIWKYFKQAFDNFDKFEKQARDHASLNKNWEDVRTSVKPDGAHIIDEAFEYCKKQMEISKNRKRE